MIDAHAHLSGRKDDALTHFAKRNGLEYTLVGLLSAMKEHGVARALLLSPPLTEGGTTPNGEVMGICRRSGGMLAPVLTVTPTSRHVAAAVSMAEKHRQTVRGFKVLLGYERKFAVDGVFDALYSYAEKERLPVMFHTGDTAVSTGSLVHSHPLTLDALADARPGLMMVACHFGNPWIEDVAELIYKHPNVYADISGMVVGGSAYHKEYVDRVADRLSGAIYFAGGADKVLFGTDFPVTSHEVALDIVKRLKVADEDKVKILSRNAKEVFRL